MKIEYTKLQRILEGISLVFLVAPFVFLPILWDGLPDAIPMHYGAAGEPDAWGGKSILIALPLISLVLYGLFTFVSLFPGKWNVPKAASETHKRLIYQYTHTLLLSEKLIIAIALAYVILTLAYELGLGIWFLPVLLIAVATPVMVYAIAVHKGRDR